MRICTVSRLHVLGFLLALLLACAVAPLAAYAATPDVEAGKMYEVKTSWAGTDSAEGSPMGKLMADTSYLVMDEGKYALFLFAADADADSKIEGFTYGSNKASAEVEDAEDPRLFVLRLAGISDPVSVNARLAGGASEQASLAIDANSLSEVDPYLQSGVIYVVPVSFKQVADGSTSMAGGFFDSSALVAKTGEGYKVMVMQLTDRAELDYLLVGADDARIEPSSKEEGGNLYEFTVDTLTGLVRMGFVYSEMGSEPRYANISFSTALARPLNLSAEWERLAGTTALDTMEEIVSKGFEASDTVVVASSGGYWDALAANSLAGTLNAPVLLTESDRLSQQTARLINDLNAKEAIICGGEFSVSDEVAREIAKLGCTVERIAGDTALDTAVKIAERVAESGTASKDCIIATAGTFQDALSAASYAYAKHAPIYLTDGVTGTLTQDALVSIKKGGYERAVVVGGTYWIPDTVLDGIAANTDVKEVLRQSGENAYETSANFATWALSQGMLANGMGVATSGTYEDALTGAAFCGKAGSVLVLADKEDSSNIDGFVADHSVSIFQGVVFGGTYWIGDDVLEKARAATKAPDAQERGSSNRTANGNAAAAAANARAAHAA